jgi:hypothetical protein
MDATWPDSAVYACPCGTLYAVTYWRWVDASARPELDARVSAQGPFDGTCPRCGATARSAGTWLRVDPGIELATLVVAEDRRGDLIEELRRHLESVQQRPHAITPWLLQPRHEFYRVGDGAAHAPAWSPEGRRLEPVIPARSGEMFIDVPPPPESPAFGTVEQGRGPSERGSSSEPLLSSSSVLGGDESDELVGPTGPRGRASEAGVPPAVRPGVPQMIGADMRTPGNFSPPVLGAYVGSLSLEDGAAVATATVDASEGDKWAQAKIVARPIHLRGLAYPLLGVRLVAAFMGQKAVVDAVVDAGAPLASELFRALSKSFVVTLRVQPGGTDLVSPTGAEGSVERVVEAAKLEPNAALCLESARGLLARGEYPPADFEEAKQQLAAMTVDERLTQTRVTIAPGAYQHIVGASEAVAALEHLDKVSNKEYLARLLEVDGMPMGEYDAIRRRVLAGSLEHGLVAPRRFWRRVVASGLVDDLGNYARLLADNRQRYQGEEGDLPSEAAHDAWLKILDLCRRKNLPIPAPCRDALGLTPHPAEHLGLGDTPERPPPPPRRSAAGQIGDGAVRTEVDPRLRDPKHRLKIAADVLQGRIGGEVDHVFAVIDDFDNDELLALLPDLSELGGRAVPNLIRKLDSERREVRQSAAILLGMALDPGALEPLADRLVREESNVWLDIARSLGAFGPVALRGLCQVLRREGGTAGEQLAIERVARALAEVALSDGEVGPGDPSPGHDAVAALADARDPRVSAAARRALATLRDVSESGAVIRGELPLAENTEVRGFARRAYEAIMVPELEVEAEV